MTIVLSSDIEKRIRLRMPSGRYSSIDELLRKALDSLEDHEQFLAGIEESLEDERAGRVDSIEEVDAWMRELHPELRKNHDS